MTEYMTAQAWVTLVVGIVAVVGVGFTIVQRTRADNRREWWARFSWALDAAYSTDADQRRDGWRIVTALTRSPLATETEETVIEALTRPPPHANNGRQQGGPP